ncbi:MAG TPA: hypothetical protein VHL08_00655 [Dongiaceae bacterium]|nr:hypothetical protein [Dongiaceae bacterium]
MTISGFTSKDFRSGERSLTVHINPASYRRTYEIHYNDPKPQGSNGGSPTFQRIPSERVSFELVFDGTGAVPSSLPGIQPFTQDGIVAQLQAFKELCFDYKGTIHSPNYLILSWADLQFSCRLQSLDITYTLFKPDGTPLRARAEATFVSYQSAATLARKAKNSSPDLSHIRTVAAGDTLPLMCHRIYGTSAVYLEVAAVNGLTAFRDIPVGTELIFPPLAEASS